jgi:hypothetical protein
MMAFTGNYSCNTLRSGLVNGTINFSSGTFKLALYTNSATLDASTAAYTSTGEATGGNYTAGGLTVVASIGSDTTTSGSTTYINFSSPSWTGSITARGALIYQSGGGNPAVCVLDFGSNKTSSTTFTVQMPQNTATSALIRLT